MSKTCPVHEGKHCLHYQEGDGDCCFCPQGLTHCDCCGWATVDEYKCNPSDDDNLCPECGDFRCSSYEDCRSI